MPGRGEVRITDGLSATRISWVGANRVPGHAAISGFMDQHNLVHRAVIDPEIPSEAHITEVTPPMPDEAVRALGSVCKEVFADNSSVEMVEVIDARQASPGPRVIAVHNLTLINESNLGRAE